MTYFNTYFKIKPISGIPRRGGILVMCSCNFLFGMQVVSTKELQRNLTIRSLNGRSSKGKGKGISDTRKEDWGPVHSIFLDAGSPQYNTILLLILPEGLFRINLQYVYIIQLRLMIYMFLIYK